MARLVDANIVIRFLLNDDPKKSEAFANLLRKSTTPLVLPDVIFAEIIWVLTSYYKVPKQQIIQSLESLLAQDSIQANKNMLGKSLIIYESFNIDYIDAYMVSYVEERDLSGIYSYDKHLDRVKTVKRLEP